CGGVCQHTQTDLANCGACGAVCMTPNATPVCRSGTCAVASCGAGFGDCDLVAMNGCEATLASDPMHCGNCVTVCPCGLHATATCSAGRCGLACATGFGDCDGNATNGCETNTLVNVANCGGCGA